jgi:DNA-directed RNA polymerase specialized sigma24 family protein
MKKANELFEQWKQTHNDEILKKIFNIYNNLLNRRAKAVANSNSMYYWDFHDVKQELQIAIYRALLFLEEHQEKEDVSYFIYRCVQNRYLNLLKGVNREKTGKSNIAEFKDEFTTHSNGGSFMEKAEAKLEIFWLKKRYPEGTIERKIIELFLNVTSSLDEIAKRLNISSPRVRRKWEKIKKEFSL